MYARKRCLLVKYAGDTRYSDECAATHDGSTMMAKTASTLADMGREWMSYDVIAVDEGQFFPDIVDWAEAAANRGKVVVICGLDGTFQRRAFGQLLHLIPMCESVTKLTAVCKCCGADASFSKRISADTEIEVIGGQDKYIPVCRRCFFDDDAARRSLRAPSPIASPISTPSPASASAAEEAVSTPAAGSASPVPMSASTTDSAPSALRIIAVDSRPDLAVVVAASPGTEDAARRLSFEGAGSVGAVHA